MRNTKLTFFSAIDNIRWWNFVMGAQSINAYNLKNAIQFPIRKVKKKCNKIKPIEFHAKTAWIWLIFYRWCDVEYWVRTQYGAAFYWESQAKKNGDAALSKWKSSINFWQHLCRILVGSRLIPAPPTQFIHSKPKKTDALRTHAHIEINCVHPHCEKF